MTAPLIHYDAVVIGAGPAGAIAARQLAIAGNSTLLVDRAAFPRQKACGCCINQRALNQLQAVGLASIVTDHNAKPLHHLHWIAGRHEAHLPLPRGVSLSRTTFDTALIEAAQQSGAHFQSRCTASLLTPDHAQPCRIVHLQKNGAQQQPIRARIVIIADGLAGRVADHEPGMSVRITPHAWMGVGATTENARTSDKPPTGTIRMICAARGYVGLVQLENNQLDIAAALDPAWVKTCGGPAQTIRAIFKENHRSFPIPLDTLHWYGTPRLTRQRQTIAGYRTFVIGDAAGYVEPFTGEGIAWALVGGCAVAPIARQVLDFTWKNEHAQQWMRTHRRLIRRRQRICRMMAAMLHHPRWTSAAVRLLNVAPSIAGPITHIMNTSKISTHGQMMQQAAHPSQQHMAGSSS